MNHHLRIASFLAYLLDTSIGIGKFRIGLEPLLGLFPVVGDIIGLIISFYIVWIGKRMGLPEKAIVKMTRNIVMDFVGGIIPFFGDIFDFAFKANTKNLKIIKEYHSSGNTLQGELVD